MLVNAEKAIQILNQGDVVGLPTETVYGLAGRIDSAQAIQKIFQIKERPFFDPLIVHVASVQQAQELVTHWPKAAQSLAEKFWPGPLTLVLKKSNKIQSIISSGLETVGIRMPEHPLALQIIREVGCPLAAPSANKFGKTSPTKAQHVEDEFGASHIAVVDGGRCNIGLESTILLIEEIDNAVRLSLLREGVVTKTQIMDQLIIDKINFDFVDKKSVMAPGNMQHHYMPDVPLILFENELFDEKKHVKMIQEKMMSLPNEVAGVKILKSTQIKKIVELHLSSDVRIACREFYAGLRSLAAQKPDIIYFQMLSEMKGEGWAALVDRMKKASSIIF